MTQPRRILPGMIVMVSRRSLRRTHLFRPDPELTQLYVYCLGVLARRYDIRVHAVVLMSTHEHLVLTDSRARLPLFLRELHRLFALGVKVLRKWEGAVWDHQRPSVVELRTPESVIEKLAYVMGNPVEAGLVRYAKDWPGIRTLPEDLGRMRLQAKRPACYFDEHSALWPEEVTLELTTPEVEGYSAPQLRSAVAVELAHVERQAQADVRARGWAFLGADRVRKASPYDRAKSWEPLRGRNPQFAVGRGQREAFFEAVASLRAFRRAYREALQRWRGGLRRVCFPSGTWTMSWLHGVNVAAVA